MLKGTEKQVKWAEDIIVEVTSTYNTIEKFIQDTEMPAEVRELFLSPVVASRNLFDKVDNSAVIIKMFKDIISSKSTAGKVAFLLAKINCNNFQLANGFTGSVKGNERTKALEENAKTYFKN